MELNLLDNDRLTKLRENRRNDKTRKICILIISFCGGILIILALAFGILKLLDSSLSSDIERNLDTLSERQGDELDRNLTIQETLANIGELHNKKQILSRLISLLEQLNVGVEYKNISISDNSETTATGVAKDFAMLDRLKNSLKNAIVKYESSGQEHTASLFKSVEITEGATEIDKEVNFRINLEYNPKIFKFSTSKVELTEEDDK